MDDTATPSPATATAPAAPARARRIATVAAVVLGLVVLAALPAAAQALGQPALVSLATRAVILAIAAGSLNIALGHGGMVSFGHAAFLGLGAYAVGILFVHARDPLFGLLPGSEQLAVTVPAAMLAAGVGAAAIGALSLRTGGVAFIMITLAFAQMLYFLFVSLKAYGGDDGLIIRRRNTVPGLNTRDDATFYWLCLAFAAVWYWLVSRLLHSRFGLALRGVRQSERRMAAMGLPVFRYKLAAFVISGVGTGLAGALLANFGRFASPDMMHWTQSGELMIMVILGGTGTLLGPALGAAVLLGLESVLAAWTEHWQLVLGPILVVLVLVLPRGLAGLAKRRGGAGHG